MPNTRRPTQTALLAIAMAATAGISTPVAAQTDSRAVAAATDAFGMRVGVEQIGLYNDSQVRGFNLQDAGNFRLDGAYFVKSANFVDPILAGVTTRVGINALATDFAAPSGVVEYRLRSPFDAPALSGEVAWREYDSRFIDLGGSMRSADGRVAALLGGQINDATSSSGLSSRSGRLGGVIEWRPMQGASVRGFASLNKFDLEGSYGVKTRGDALPPVMPHPNRYVPAWSDHDGKDISTGLIAQSILSPALRAKGSLIYSRLELDKADYTLLQVDRDGDVQGETVSNRPRVNASWSGSAGLEWRPAPNQRLFGEMRARRSRSVYGPAVVVGLDDFRLEDGIGPTPPQPALPDTARTVDQIEQLTAGIGYETTLGRLRLKGGVQKTRYARTIAVPAAPIAESRQSPWLYDASLVYAINDAWTAFATTTRGLEESGVAPNNAVNRGDILDAAVSTQSEIGLRSRLSNELTLIGSLYAIKKPAAGFDADNVYRLIGDLSHRGGELSLVGRVAPDIRIVAGVAYLEARRSGEPVDRGIWSAEAVGLPKIQAMIGATWHAPWAQDLSFDGQISHASDRRARSIGDLRTPATTTVDVGLRQVFQVEGRDVTLRARLLNLLDEDGWVATRTETMDRPNRRGARLSLAMAF